jgi:hypothetical protein
MDWKKKWKKFNVDPERCTCLNCEYVEECPFSFSLYNIDGECLIKK